MTSASPAEPVTTFENASGTTQTTTETPTIPKAKLSAINRFKSLTSSGFRSSSTPTQNFPPDSWALSEAPDTGSGASSWSNDVERWKSDLERWREQIKSGFSPSIPPTPPPATPAQESGNIPEDRADAPDSEQEDAKDSPEPTTLAMRIKSIIDENFKFASTQKTTTATESEKEATTSNTSPPTSPEPSSSTSSKPENNTENNSMFNFSVDAKLANILSSETMMNGVEKGRESVWTILDRMGYGKDAKGQGKEKDESPQQQQNEVEEDGIMFYTPLQPTTELSPEIAESVLEDQAEASSPAVPQHPNEGNPPKPKQKRVFQPSATQLSLQCTWWGYRLFIPPPIMAQLSNAHIAAAKRGAMIAAALKWLLDKAPMMIIPPQFRPAMLLLRSFSPYLGYVGAFVAWSWGRVESKDTGNGVVLTATWLLPVAILPASWDFEAHGVPVEPTPDAGSITPADSSSSASAPSYAAGVTTTSVESKASTSQLHHRGKDTSQKSETKPNTPNQQPNATVASSAKVPLAHAASSKASTGASPTLRDHSSSSPALARSKSSTTTTGGATKTNNSNGARTSSMRQAVRRATTAPTTSTSSLSTPSVRASNVPSPVQSTPKSILRPSTLAPPSPSSTKNGGSGTSSPLRSILRKPSPLSDTSSPKAKETSSSFFRKGSDDTTTHLKNRTDLR